MMTASLVVFLCLIGFGRSWSFTGVARTAFRQRKPFHVSPTPDKKKITMVGERTGTKPSMASSSSDVMTISSSALATLQEQGFTKGLATALARNKLALCKQFWVVDNSGSMMTRDGHRLVTAGTPHDFYFVDCTRWTELQQTIEYHAQLAALLQSPTEFRMLNDPGRIVGPKIFSVGAERGGAASTIDEDLAIARATIQNAEPSGATPLTGHLHEIRQTIVAMEPSLRANGGKVAIILATDGMPTDEQGFTSATLNQDFSNAVRALEGLPVWMVIRLCTDDDSVVNYWNSLDSDLELSIEVLDDILSEAQEVYEHNPWLNYGLPIHRMRELGFHARVFDEIDEQPLSKNELRTFFAILLGQDQVHALPEPEVNWKDFCSGIAALVAKEHDQWNPISNRMEPWVDMSALEKQYC